MAKELGGAVRAQIEAAPEWLWAIVADPSRHPELSGSKEPQETHLLGEGPLDVGSRFESRQKAMGMKYSSTSVVTACQEPRLLRWNLDGTVDWEFRFEPAATAGEGDARTQVIHQYRWQLKMPGLVRLLLSPLLNFRNRQNTRGMVGTVRNLARLAGAPEPTDVQVSQEPPSLTAV